MTLSIASLERRFYPNYVDEHARFDALIRHRLRPDMNVLDAGAGRGLMYPYDYRLAVTKMAGADTDPAVLENPNVTEAVVADLSSLPYPEGEFDLVFSKYVFEHIARPAVVMRELRRVMKPGAHLLVHTPNRWHYVAMAATITPIRFHVWFNERRGRPEADTFPTLYRINDRRRMEHLAAGSGFRLCGLQEIETKPDYLSFHPLAYLVGIAYERVVNSSDRFSGARVQLIADFEAR